MLAMVLVLLITYKGMLLAGQVGNYYLDLRDERFDLGAGPGASALLHQHLPDLGLAQPFRMICHNGEINTLRGNVNWMAARRHTMRSEVPRRRSRQASGR
jgi:glutamate synthase (NADPH/NADH) large chain